MYVCQKWYKSGPKGHINQSNKIVWQHCWPIISVSKSIYVISDAVGNLFWMKYHIKIYNHPRRYVTTGRFNTEVRFKFLVIPFESVIETKQTQSLDIQTLSAFKTTVRLVLLNAVKYTNMWRWNSLSWFNYSRLEGFRMKKIYTKTSKFIPSQTPSSWLTQKEHN